MKKRIITGVLLVLLLNIWSMPVFAAGFENFNWLDKGVVFNDVPEDSWYYESVFKASACGVINGIGNNMFNPNGTLTHAEAMTLMAKTYAIYHGVSDQLAEVQMSSSGSHWASGIQDFCKENALPHSNVSEFDTPITRNTLAEYFYNSLPNAIFSEGISNDLALMPEATTNVTVKALFKAGIMVGDAGGFRLQDSITRAEVAAIILRVANPDARVKVDKKITNQDQSLAQEKQGEIQTDKPYKRIPNTKWSMDPTGGITVHSHFGDINTKYGNHFYGCQNQREYDKVMSVIDEAFKYACQQEAKNKHNGNVVKDMASSDNKVVGFYKTELGINSDREISNMRITENIVSNMRQYLIDTYATLNEAGKNSDINNNNVYKYLFGGGMLDCDGNGYFNMLCWDYLGFSTRMITSMRIAHATSQVYVNGHWIMLNQDSGKFDYCTHEQLLELISGVKNDAYSTHNDTDAMIKSASALISNGNASYKLDDLEVWPDETPTHNPWDNSVK